jgi:predicted nucleic acid-binding protein
VKVIVDTSVWSLALRRNEPSDHQSAAKLKLLLERKEKVILLGVVLQELLHGVRSSAGFEQIRAYLEELPMVTLQRDDYIAAAKLQNDCRAGGVQISTTDAQIAAACLEYDCALLTCDKDFEHISRICPLQLL